MFWQFFMLKSESLTSLFRSFLISELSHLLPSLFFLKRELSDSLPSLFTNNRPEWLAQVAHIKRAKVRFAQKTSKSHFSSCAYKKKSNLLEKPISEFPTLLCLFALIKETVYQDIRPFFPKTLHLGHLWVMTTVSISSQCLRKIEKFSEAFRVCSYGIFKGVENLVTPSLLVRFSTFFFVLLITFFHLFLGPQESDLPTSGA